MAKESLYLVEYSTLETDKWMTVIQAIAYTEGRLDEDRLKRLEEVLTRAKMVEVPTGFKLLKDPEFESVEETPYEANLIDEKDFITCIERGYDIVKELDDKRYIGGIQTETKIKLQTFLFLIIIFLSTMLF